MKGFQENLEKEGIEEETGDPPLKGNLKIITPKGFIENSFSTLG